MANLPKMMQFDVDFIRVLKRSADVGDGWRNVSETVKPLVTRVAPDLIRIRTTDEGQFQVKLSPKGEVLGEYV